jgi:hypothetical protein
MSYRKWSLGKKWSPDLAITHPDDFEGVKAQGFEYQDGSWIQMIQAHPPRWHIIVGNEEFNSQNFDKVEQALWEWHAKANDEADPNSEENIIRDYKQWCKDNKLEHLSMDEQRADLYAKMDMLQETSIELNIFLKRWDDMLVQTVMNATPINHTVRNASLKEFQASRIAMPAGAASVKYNLDDQNYYPGTIYHVYMGNLWILEHPDNTKWKGTDAYTMETHREGKYLYILDGEEYVADDLHLIEDYAYHRLQDTFSTLDV